MSIRGMVTGGGGCSVPGERPSASSSNPLGALADSILGSAAKQQERVRELPSLAGPGQASGSNLFGPAEAGAGPAMMPMPGADMQSTMGGPMGAMGGMGPSIQAQQFLSSFHAAGPSAAPGPPDAQLEALWNEAQHAQALPPGMAAGMAPPDAAAAAHFREFEQIFGGMSLDGGAAAAASGDAAMQPPASESPLWMLMRGWMYSVQCMPPALIPLRFLVGLCLRAAPPAAAGSARPATLLPLLHTSGHPAPRAPPRAPPPSRAPLPRGPSTHPQPLLHPGPPRVCPAGGAGAQGEGFASAQVAALLRSLGIEDLGEGAGGAEGALMGAPGPLGGRFREFEDFWKDAGEVAGGEGRVAGAGGGGGGGGWVGEFEAQQQQRWREEGGESSSTGWADEFAEVGRDMSLKSRLWDWQQQQRVRDEARAEGPRSEAERVAARQQTQRIVDTLAQDPNPKFQQSKFLQFVSKMSRGELIAEEGGVREVSPAEAAAAAAAEQWASEFENLHQHEHVHSHAIKADADWATEFAARNESSTSLDSRDWADEFAQQMAHTHPHGHTHTEGEGVVEDGDPSAWLESYERYVEEQLRDEQQRRAESSSSRWPYAFADKNPYVGHAQPFQQGQDLFRRGLLSEAILALEAEVLRNENNAEAWRLLGVSHAENDDDRQAIAAMTRARDADPTNLDVLLALGVSHTNELEQAEALYHLRSWLQNHSKYKSLVPPSGPASMSHSDVVQLYTEATRMAPEDADLQVVLGVLFNLSHEYDRAKAAFRRALALRPSDYSLWNKLGATQANSAQSAEAIEAYQKALDLKPNYVRAWTNMGIGYANQGKYEESARYYVRAIAMNPTAENAWQYLRIALSCAGKAELLPACDAHDVDALQRDEVPAVSGENIHSSALVCNAESNPRELKPVIDGQMQNSPQLIAYYSPSSTPRTPGSSSSFRCSPVRKLPALSPIAEVRSPHIIGAPVSPPPLTTPVFSSIPPLTNISPDGQAGSPDSAVSADPNAGPFTISQWQQLEKQALIFKYIVSGVSPPQDLVASLYASPDTSKGPRESERGEWMHPMRLDLEPDRCRRTDGKKWRCSREAVKDQKYCDRHMHRGRNRSRKTNENCTAGSNASIAAASSDGPASEVAGGINAATSSIAESAITQTRHNEHAVVSASERKNDSRCESSAQMGERSALPPLTLPPPVHPMGAAQVEPSSGLNSRATATSTWQTNPTTFQSQAQQEQHSMQHPPQDQQAVPHSGGMNQSINCSTSSRVQQYQLSGNLGPRFTSSFQPVQPLQVENTTAGTPSTSKSLGVSSSIVGLNSGPTQSGNHGTAGGQLQPGHYQIQHTPRAAIWERDGDDDTPGSSSRVPLLRLPNMLQRSASLQIASSYSDKSHIGHHLSYAPAPVRSVVVRPIRSQRLIAVCAARSPKSTDAAPARRPASAPFRLLSAPVAALPLVLAFVEAELPNAIDTFTALSDFHITEPAFKAFYMIFTCVFCWGALVFGSMNDEYYESDEYRKAGGNGTQFWIYQRVSRTPMP
ncbi:unnamed protein product [Closterium sp. Yama58-4]|nr:unnamed protein product [Closterium sp. Yama58-4]